LAFVQQKKIKFPWHAMNRELVLVCWFLLLFRVGLHKFPCNLWNRRTETCGWRSKKEEEDVE